MRFFGLLLLLFSSQVLAAANFEFQYSATKSSVADIRNFNLFLKNNRHIAFSNQPGITLDGLLVNQVGLNPSDQSLILFKSGLQASDPSAYGKILKHPDGFLYHGKGNESKQSFALFFTLKSRSKVNRLIKQFETLNLAVNSKTSWLFPVAHAQCYSCDQASNPFGPRGERSLRQTAALTQKASDEALSKGVFKCLGQVWDGFSGNVQGTVSGIAGLAKGIGSGFVSLLSNPRQFWKKASTGAKAVWELSKKIPKMVGSMVEGLKDFGVNIKMSFMCALTGMLGAEGAMALLTGGATTAKLAATISSLALSFSKVMPLLKWMDKLPDTDKAKNADMESIMSKLSRFPKGLLNSIQDISGIGLNKAARKMATCGV